MRNAETERRPEEIAEMRARLLLATGMLAAYAKKDDNKTVSNFVDDTIRWLWEPAAKRVDDELPIGVRLSD